VHACTDTQWSRSRTVKDRGEQPPNAAESDPTLVQASCCEAALFKYRSHWPFHWPSGRMDHAASFRCPNCGAPVGAKARACGFCRAALATHRCSHCFDLSAAGAKHCGACGRELGLEFIAEPSGLLCPACRSPLGSITEASGTLFDCVGCGGHFVEHALLRSLLERRSALTGARPRPFKPSNPLASKLCYRPCARCEALMHRKNFGDTSGVVIDVCSQHGIWFDQGELPAVLDFVEGGGLERAQRRVAEAAKAEETQRRIGATRAPGLGVADVPLNTVAEQVLDFLIRVLLHL
jgi:Zn-finger nucleic acid-binding protein